MKNIESSIQKFSIIDAHCDSILNVVNNKNKLGEINKEAQADIPRLLAANVKLQFFAMFIETKFKPAGSVLRALEGIAAFHREIEENNEKIFLIDSQKKLELLFNQDKKIGAILAIEGGEALGGNLFMLHILYRLGVRSIGLTWNQRNEIADGVGVGRNHRGLTQFGKQVVNEMNELGMLIDLSHIGEKGFWDVLRLSKKPVILTHANCRALCDHPRNLNDEQLKALASQGGCIGITFVPQFLDKKQPSISKVADHIEYAVEKMGINHVGIGSDFDGMDTRTPGLENADKYPKLIETLSKRGFLEKEIEKIMSGNWLRILKEELKG